ncbi:lysosomal Pro-X carboxypeptidase isoform X2 [Mangifera indica]|uniref:lysosomal Pro-X carboxypeptidase isoform X2 n=1 Tax=Mangifera indica TaxID=29780 RepID=UPI001CF9808C|nr:lysosomal Pro-X carboxypeptidase isoform X2 [Mangifera indica]XP_044510945.1 lysosomal Pro-X carboxypeptidase isoform X2 [Mangifera indica]XP_044510954.1 lysosomal Pro-X carboxypeptidase isoform X2 [Mangifera indica]
MAKSTQRYIVLSIIIVISISLPSALASQPFKFKRNPRLLGSLSKQMKPQPQPQQQQQQYQYETKYFEQRLDHFSFVDLPNFRQRYLINTEHWLGPSRLGPIFLYCGNEGDIEWFAVNSGFMWDIAPKFGAMLIFPEHRYYGESLPYGSREEAYRNATMLSYLTAEQALADFAVLITDLKRNLSAEACPVVLFGGSYGGMLAAWMRLKYPHISIGALASSAPILQFEDIVPAETFYNLVSNDFKRESTSCFNTIKKSWDELISEGQKENGLHQLAKTFHLCQDLKKVEDLADWLESAYSYLAMVDYPYPSDFMMPLPGYPIREVCNKIDNSPKGSSILEGIFEGVSVYYNYTGQVDCFELDDDPHGLDGWNWQACTEMVMPMSSSQDASMFPTYDFNYSSFQEECWKEFKVVPRPQWITTQFGGHDVKTVLKLFGSNIIFSNGLLDPWSGGSVLQNISDTIVALVTNEEISTKNQGEDFGLIVGVMNGIDLSIVEGI